MSFLIYSSVPRGLQTGFILIIFLFVGLPFAPAGPGYIPGEVLVTLSPAIHDGSAWFSGQGLSASGVFPEGRAAGWQAPRLYRVVLAGKESVPEAVVRLRRMPGVLSAQPNYLYHLCDIFSDDPQFSTQWALHNTGQSGGTVDADIDAPEAWETTTGAHEVIVAVIDTGMDYTHPDLLANLWTNPGESDPFDGIDNDLNGYVDDWRGWDFRDNDNDPWDDHSHGTHVSGTIGAVGNNGVGVSGVCWNVRLMPLDTFDASGDSTSADLVEAVNYAEHMGARIINASWGDQYDDPALKQAIDSFTSAGGLFVCAAGNEYGENNDWFTSFPANYDIDALISVGASTRNDYVAGFSSIGPNRVHLFAPGDSIYNTYPTNRGSYGTKSGTSMASPHVAGVAALLWAWEPSLTNLQVKYRILGGAQPGSAFALKALAAGRLNASTVFAVDSIAPAAVADLSVSRGLYDRLNLRFTAPGDDGDVGTARFLDIRYATGPISEANWEQAIRAYDEPAPAPAGTPQLCTLLRLDEGREYFIRMKVIDDAGNLSALSNEAVGQTEAPADLFRDDMEAGVGAWRVLAGSSWARTSLLAKSGSFSWTDSPAGHYVPGDNYLISPLINLAGAGQPVLRFWHRYDLQPASWTVYDYADVQACTDGVNWSAPLARYSDSADWWLLETIDLSPYRGQPTLWLRFHLHADGYENFDGWYIDDVRVLDLAPTTAVERWASYR